MAPASFASLTMLFHSGRLIATVRLAGEFGCVQRRPGVQREHWISTFDIGTMESNAHPWCRMNVDRTIADLASLPVVDRVRIVQAIWDTLPDDTDIGVSSEQQAELDRRIAAHDADPGSSISREELMRRLRGDS